MANLAENASAALLWVIDPMIFRQHSRVHAIVHHQRARIPKEGLHLFRHRREPAIEADHQVAGVAIVSRFDLAELRLSQAQRLLTENMLSRFQSPNHLLRMQMMTCRDHNGVDLWIRKDLFFVARAELETELLS